MRLAVAGCGTAAEFFHLPAIARVVPPDDVWLVDPDRERVLGLARRFGREDHVAADHRELVGRVDAAIVAVPNDLHAPVACDLLAAGVHVLCEKPLAATVEDAERIVEAAGDGTVLAVGNFRRFFPATRLVAELLRRDLLGAVASFEAEEGFVHSWGSTSGFWLDRRRAGGGVLVDLGSHVLDQLLLWLGPLEVVSYEDNAHGGVECDCRGQLVAGTARGTLELSRTRDLGSRARIVCERGSLEAPLAEAGAVRLSLLDGGTYVLDVDGSAGSPDKGYAAAFEAQLRDFLTAVEERRRPTAAGEDGLRAVRLIGDCYAARTALPEPWVFETLSTP